MGKWDSNENTYISLCSKCMKVGCPALHCKVSRAARCRAAFLGVQALYRQFLASDVQILAKAEKLGCSHLIKP
jgi:hypothetical protein